MDRPAGLTAWFGDSGDDRLDPGHRGTMAESLESLLACGSIVPASLCRLPQGIAGVVDQKERSLFFGVALLSEARYWIRRK